MNIHQDVLYKEILENIEFLATLPRHELLERLSLNKRLRSLYNDQNFWKILANIRFKGAQKPNSVSWRNFVLNYIDTRNFGVETYPLIMFTTLGPFYYERKNNLSELDEDDIDLVMEALEKRAEKTHKEHIYKIVYDDRKEIMIYAKNKADAILKVDRKELREFIVGFFANHLDDNIALIIPVTAVIEYMGERFFDKNYMANYFNLHDPYVPFHIELVK